MSRDDGFSVMDVSTGYVDDPKWRKLARHAPDQLGPAFIAYTATMAESWRAGRRVTVEDAWPALIPFEQAVVNALVHVKLLDRRGYVGLTAWNGWFDVARKRREQSRVRWAKYNASRTKDDAATTSQPRGSNAVTASSVPPVRSSRTVPPVDSREIPPPPAERGRRANGTNPRVAGTSPRKQATNPRATKTSIRDARADQKRGPTKLAEALRKAAKVELPADGVEDSWFAGRPPAEAPS